jgi:hypothetical protein
MRLRSVFVTTVATLGAFAPAGAASAHEEINPKTFPTGQAAFLTLTAANEASVDLIRIVLRAPAGLAFGEATRSPAGWSAATTDNTITWTGGAVKPHTFESFGFEVAGADQPATLTYRVTLGYAGGKTDEHEVDVTAAAGTGGAGSGGSPATTVTTAVTATSASPATEAAAPAGSAGQSDDESGTAKAALGISILALLLAAAALLTGARRGGGPGTNRPSGDGTAAGAAQDW